LLFRYCSRLIALQVKCKVRYLNLLAVQNQTSPLVLTFGVADPVGAIGIQADLASFAAMGCHGLSVITSILIGDTTGIEDSQIIDADWVADQARVVLEDMPVAAFKVGAVGSIENVSVIAEIVSDYPDIPLILDPFSTAMPDQGLDSEDLLVAMRELLIPQTTLLLVSAVELARFAETWREPSTDDTMALDAMRIIDLGCEYLFVTGTPCDVHDVANTLFNESGVVRHDNWQRQTYPRPYSSHRNLPSLQSPMHSGWAWANSYQTGISGRASRTTPRTPNDSFPIAAQASA
jgi:hydroxymethylpyrimidine/phosphomethylpyrimidine kinase